MWQVSRGNFDLREVHQLGNSLEGKRQGKSESMFTKIEDMSFLIHYRTIDQKRTLLHQTTLQRKKQFMVIYFNGNVKRCSG